MEIVCTRVPVGEYSISVIVEAAEVVELGSKITTLPAVNATPSDEGKVQSSTVAMRCPRLAVTPA